MAGGRSEERASAMARESENERHTEAPFAWAHVEDVSGFKGRAQGPAIFWERWYAGAPS